MRVLSVNTMVQVEICVHSVLAASSTVGVLDQDILLDSRYSPEITEACPGCLFSVFSLKPHLL